jgi:hypothetical protein
VGLARLTEVMGTALDFDFVLCDFQMPVRDKARLNIPATISILHAPRDQNSPLERNLECVFIANINDSFHCGILDCPDHGWI